VLDAVRPGPQDDETEVETSSARLQPPTDELLSMSWPGRNPGLQQPGDQVSSQVCKMIASRSIATPAG
jgi:hypothetical protein